MTKNYDFPTAFLPDGTLRPIPPMSEILPGLFQGMRPASYRGYDLVVSCEWYLAKGPMEDYEGTLIHVPMHDDDNFHPPELQIKLAVDAIAEMRYHNKKVLVHCTGGLNRSSLVTGRYLTQWEEMAPSEAVTLLRVKRDPFVLCNRAFERWVLGDQLPTAETTTPGGANEASS